MVLNRIVQLEENPQPLELIDCPVPSPSDNEVLIRIAVCGVCHTEIDEIEGRTAPAFFPMIPGHQVAGTVEKIGTAVSRFMTGDRVGVAWIYSACGECDFCQQGLENLCRNFMATGRDANGGYAEYMTVKEEFAFQIPAELSAASAAPLLCAGAIGYRSIRLAGLENGQKLGLTGFGASAHLVLKMVQQRFPDTDIYVFARNAREREFACELGAVWAGDTKGECPQLLNSIIDTTPVWIPVVEALNNLAPDGRLVINAIRKESVDQDYLLNLDYPRHLWMEKEIKTVANVTRRDVSEFLKLAGEIALQPEIQEYCLEDANQALRELKSGHIRGAKVLRINFDF